ncbi:hypothetical protein ACH9D2_10270 [Kocuria sp. M4R2S49]|uniref:hypothetical protein n=1 Tax=Kocuria rhizosphaericola TaxID=3376284 RepID=UPI0037A53A56
MSRTISVIVRIDRSAHTVTLDVTGAPIPGDRRELHRMTARARTLFPDAAVTVDLSSTRTPEPQDPQGDNTNHPGDGQPEISSAPAAPHLVTASSR